MPKYSSKKLWENPIGQKLHVDVAQGLSEVRKVNSTDLVKVVYGDNIMVNATEMAKPFDKRPIDWLRLPSTTSFISDLTTVRKSHSDDFQAVTTVNGGANPGTWLHEDVAMEFAQTKKS